MEFVLLIGEGGELWKTWVAAFYERRLRRQDYRDADVKRTVSFIIEKHLASIPLHCHGHLLLGLCRILLRKAELLDDAAEELRVKLLTSSGRGAGGANLPGVRRLVFSDVTLSHVVGEDVYMDASSAGLDDLFALSNIGASLEIPGLNMLLEPEVPPMEADLDEGRSHAAPWSRITLPPDRPLPFPTDGPRETFGEAPQEVVDVMTFLRERVTEINFGPAQRLLDPDTVLPIIAPFDYLLGGGDDEFDAGHPGFSDSHRGPGLPPIDSPRGDRDGGHSGTGGRPVDQTPNLDDPSGTPTQDVLPERLDFDISPGAPLFPGGGRLSDLLDLNSPRPAPGTGRLSIGPIDLGPEPDLPTPEGPRRKRQRRQKAWFDEETTMTTTNYHDTANISLDPQTEFRLYLPHSRPGLPYATVLSNMCDQLSMSQLRAPQIEEREFQAARSAQAARDAEAAAAVEAAEAAAARALAAAAAAARDAMDVDLGPALSPVRDLLSQDGGGWHMPDFLGDGRRSSPEHQLPGLDDPDHHDLPPADKTPPRRDDSSSPRRDRDHGHEPEGDDTRHPGTDDGRHPESDLPSHDHPGHDQSGDDLPAHDLPSHDPGRSPGLPGQDVISFFQLCAAGGGSAEGAARQFVGLLSKHMDGIICMEQAEAYGDIQIRRGPGFPPEAEKSGGA